MQCKSHEATSGEGNSRKLKNFSGNQVPEKQKTHSILRSASPRKHRITVLKKTNFQPPPKQSWRQLSSDRLTSKRSLFISENSPSSQKMKSVPTPIGYTRISLYQSAHTVPDAAVVFEGAGRFLTFQTELDCTWIVFLLKEERGEVIYLDIMLKKIHNSLCAFSIV